MAAIAAVRAVGVDKVTTTASVIILKLIIVNHGQRRLNNVMKLADADRSMADAWHGTSDITCSLGHPWWQTTTAIAIIAIAVGRCVVLCHSGGRLVEDMPDVL